MVRVLIVIVFAIALAGCGAKRWVKTGPGMTDAMAQQDLLACEYQAKVATPNYSSGRGLERAIGDGIEQGMRLVELRSMCMKVKGYELVDAEPK